MVGAMNTRIVFVIQLRGIKTQQDVNLVTRPVFGLIDLVVFDERGREVANGGKIRIFINDRSVKRHPWMLIEPAPDHLSVFRPLVVGIQRGMHSNEAFCVVFDDRNHFFFWESSRSSSPVVLMKTMASK